MDVQRIDTLPRAALDDELDEPAFGLVDLLTWIGQGKRLVAVTTVACAAAALGASFLLTPIYTARTALMPPQGQQGGSAAALAALGSLGGLAGLGGSLGAKSPDELYIALLKSDSVVRELDRRFQLRERYKLKNHEALRKTLPSVVRVTADKKSGVIALEVDDESPQFAADLANAHYDELGRLLSRLAVSEAQQRRVFFEQQLKDTRENLVRAEHELQQVQEKSGVIVLDKQAEALISGAARLRAEITEREVRLKVMRTSATEQNPDVQRLTSELSGLRAELARMESRGEARNASPVDLPVGRIPAASIDYVRARRDLKIQETILEGMLRQYEMAKLDEAKEGPVLQQIDRALPPDYKSKPSRALLVIAATLLALLGSSAVAVWRGYAAARRERAPESEQAWQSLRQAWRWRRG